MKLKHLLVLIAFLFVGTLGNSVQAQKFYESGFGLRLGGFNGITYKQYVTERNSFELFGAIRGNGRLSVTGIYQWNFFLGNLHGLTWHAGPGLQASFPTTDETADLYLGGDINLGIEYKFDGVPFTVGLDYDLAINVMGDSNVNFNGIAFVLRYVW